MKQKYGCSGQRMVVKVSVTSQKVTEKFLTEEAGFGQRPEGSAVESQGVIQMFQAQRKQVQHPPVPLPMLGAAFKWEPAGSGGSEGGRRRPNSREKTGSQARPVEICISSEMEKPMEELKENE